MAGTSSDARPGQPPLWNRCAPAKRLEGTERVVPPDPTMPPLCITEKDLEEALEMIGDTLDEMFGGDAEEDEDAEDAG